MKINNKQFLLASILTISLTSCQLSAGVPASNVLPTDTQAPTIPTETPIIAEDTPVPEPAVPTATDQPTSTSVPTTTPEVPNAAIIGRIFHDECIYSGGAIQANIPDGCVNLGENALLANGNLDGSESGIANIEVILNIGACPGVALQSTRTNQEGYFAFSELLSGDYCIEVDPTSNSNTAVAPPLLPGVWSTSNQGVTEIQLAPGQQNTEINFGWDYLNLPLPDKGCTDVATFISDSSYDPGWHVTMGEVITKTWLVRNDGTCAWNSAYQIVHQEGFSFSNENPVNLGDVISPGETAEISITLQAQDQVENQQGAWIFKTDQGVTMNSAEGEIIVLSVDLNTSPELSMLNSLGTPSFRDTFDNAEHWNPFEDDYATLSISRGRFVLQSKTTIGWDSWTYGPHNIHDATIEAIFTTGEACDGFDRYGLIVRSADGTKGYFAGISCNGYYSIRKWNGIKWDKLSGWDLGEGINLGPDQTNHIVVILQHDMIALYVNGILQDEVQDTIGYSPYFTGHIGPFIAAQETQNFTVYLEELAFWAIP